MRTLISIAALACFATGCVVTAASDDSSLLVSNHSDFEVDEIYVTAVNSSSWGPNLLNSTLFPGESVYVGIDCGTYDAMLIDENGDACEINDVHLCFDDADWVIHNKSCALFEARAAAAAK